LGKAHIKYACRTLAQEALALNQLYKSISLEMKSKCIDKECETVATAVDIVEKHEAIFELNDKKKVIISSFILGKAHIKYACRAS
jgi:hypothetical protein